MYLFLFYICAFTSTFASSHGEKVCYKNDVNCSKDNQSRYLFYEVNAPEGFNLRRDVYMRFAVLVHHLQKLENKNLKKFKLVLPPWSRLVHWSYSETPERIPWGLFFDLDSLKSFAPVIEMHEFFSEYKEKGPKVIIEEVYTLQHCEDMFQTGKFEERMQLEDCQRKNDVTFFFFSNMTSNYFRCLSYHGHATYLAHLLFSTPARTILINHAEIALHESFGNSLYWQARRSMRFNKELKRIAGEFRSEFLDSDDEKDNTALPENWKDEQPRRDALGGPYLAVHLRRRDFVRSRPNDTPPINHVAHQITKTLNTIHLNTVFVATDGTDEEFKMLSEKLAVYNVVRYIPTLEVKNKYKEGGIAIIDQILCSYARYFIGTHESTFSFRIQEEREILGFPTETTFNSFCKNEENCDQPTVWPIVY